MQSLMLSAVGMTAPVVEALPAIEAARLYGRFAEKQLFLDAKVGACCHSACSDW